MRDLGHAPIIIRNYDFLPKFRTNEILTHDS